MKKKVLQVVGSLNIGGTETVALNIARHLKSKGIDCDFLVFHKTDSFYEKEALAMGCKVWVINSPSKSYFNYFRSLIKIFKRERYDIVHSHITLNTGIVLLAAKLCNVQIRISHAHFTNNGLVETPIYKIYKTVMRVLIAMNATERVACGEEAGVFLYGKKTKKISVLNNAIDINKFKFDQTKRMNIRKEFNFGEDILIGHVGRLSPVKNHFFMLEVLRELIAKKFECKLLFVGDGEIKEELIAKINTMNLQDKVFLTGNRSDVDAILSALDIFIFPSFNEGLPLTLVEAQVSNLPCLVSDTITKEVWINKNMWYLSLEEGPTEWANKVIDSYINKRDNSVSKGLLDIYSLESFNIKIENLYQLKNS